MKKQKILILAQTPPPYHGQAVILDAFVKAKWDWCQKKHIRLNYSNSIESVGRFSFTKVFKMIKIISQVYQEKNTGGIDVIVYPPAPARRIPFYRDIITLFFIRRWSKKTVFHFHSGGFHDISLRFSSFEKLIAKKIYSGAQAIVLSPNFQKDEIGWLQLNEIYINASGAEDNYSPHKIKKRKTIAILSIGLLSEDKGIMISLEAARLLKNKKLDFKWLFVGGFQSKNFRSEAENFVKNNHLEKNIEFKDPVSGKKKWDLYEKSDIVCFPTYYSIEVMPIVIIEAMMMKKAIVSTKWRAINDMIENEKDGLLVEIRNPNAVARALERLIENKTLRTQIARKARKKYLNDFTLAIHVKKMEKIYKEIMKEI